MQTDTVIYSGSVTKLLFALLHSSSIQLESYFTNQQASLWQFRTSSNRDLELHVSMNKAFRAKAKAEREIKGDLVLHYSMLRDHVVEIQSTNPYTTLENICLFRSIKMSFRDCKRDLLGFDGAFIKGPFPGQVLAAVGLDSNNVIYPLAYALVEAKSKSSWCWFLQGLGDDIDQQPNSNFIFINNRQKGIIPVIKTVFPSAEHRFCL
ncbi:chloroplast stem-loop binding protein of 41 kDa b, chloroplastic [Tanacetum coccineum]